MLDFYANYDLALTYALRRPSLALQSAWCALRAALAIKRPDLAYQANELISAIGGAP